MTGHLVFPLLQLQPLSLAPLPFYSVVSQNKPVLTLPFKKNVWPCTCAAGVQLGLHVAPQQLGQGPSDSEACLWVPFP